MFEHLKFIYKIFFINIKHIVNFTFMGLCNRHMYHI